MSSKLFRIIIISICFFVLVKAIVKLAIILYFQAPFDPKYTDSFNLYTNVLLTIGLVAITASSAVDTQEILKQSKKEQRIRYLEKSLESFYIPVQDILKDQRYILKENTLKDSSTSRFMDTNFNKLIEKYNEDILILFKGIKNPTFIVYFDQVNELKKCSCYRYLAQGETYSLFLDLTTIKYDSNYLNALEDKIKKLSENVGNDIKKYQEELDQHK